MMIKKLLIAGALSGGLVVSAAGAVLASTSHHVSTARTVAVHHVSAGTTAVHHASAAGTAAVHHASTAAEDPTGEGTSQESDGPGGWADPDGVNVDHQFDGTE